MTNAKKIFIGLTLLLILTAPLTTQAKFNPFEPIVPQECRGDQPCTNPCLIFKLINNVVQFVIVVLILPATVIALLIGGILLVTSGGSEKKMEQGKSIIWNTVLGFIIAFGAWLIINTILQEAASGGFKGLLKQPRCEELQQQAQQSIENQVIQGWIF